jgi:hypothetical protein
MFEMETLKAPRKALALAWIAAALAATSAFGKIAPELAPRTLVTEHFRVHYPLHYEKFADALAERLEEAFGLLSRDFDWRPEGVVEVVVRSDIDQANGLAEVFPYNRIVVHAVPPNAWGFDAETDDWLRTLAIHELTHIIANDESSGVFRYLRSIFGSAAKTNPYQPVWLVEGLAVYEETRFTRAGRGRSTWSDLVLRASADAGLLEAEGHPANPESDPALRISLDRLNDGVDPWPGAHVPYLFGYVLTETLADRRGAGTPAALSRANSGHLPFAVEKVAEEVLGSGYPAIWSEAVARVKRFAKVDAELIREAGSITRGKEITSIGRRTRGIGVFGDFAYFIRDSYRTGTGLTRVSLHSGERKDLTDFPPFDLRASTESWGNRVRTTPTGDGLLYSRLTPFLEHSLFSEAFFFDPETGTETVLTTGARAVDPDPSPDFRWDSREKKIAAGSIVYVKHLADARQAIVRREAGAKNEEEILVEGEMLERLSSPTWGRSGEWIVYVSRPPNSGSSLRATNLKTKRKIVLTLPESVREMVTGPTFSSEGDLIFSSNRGGVFNLRQISAVRLSEVLDGRAKGTPRMETLTNAKYGLFEPAFGKRAEKPVVFALEYGERGLDLVEIPFSGKDLPAPKIGTVREKIRSVSSSEAENAATSPSRLLHSERRRYSVWPAVLPHYWAPDLRRVPDGFRMGALTGSLDAWERHDYRIFLGGDTRANFPVWDFTYRYDGFIPTLEFSTRQENRYFATYQESNRSRITEATAYIPAGRYSTFGIGATASTSRLFSEERSTGGFELSWRFRRMKVYPDSIDREGESGIAGSAGLTGFVVGEERFSEFRSGIETRVPSLFERHFLRLRASYATANNDRLSRHYFLGGGEETISRDQTDLLRGYEPGTIFGRRILTTNVEYVFPMVDLFRGLGTFPVFFERSRLKLFYDAGSAEIVGTEPVNLRRWVSGAGMHLLSDFNFFYRVPVTFAVGVDHGLRRDYGGETRFVLGLFSRWH